MPDIFLASPWGALWWGCAVVIGLTVHEFAHATTAVALGDETPKREGRLTLIPFPHLDPIGLTLFLFLGFGWAKPVQFEKGQLRLQTFGSTAVSFAGPIANFFLVVLTIIFARVLVYVGVPFGTNIHLFFLALITVNVILFFLNFIPLPPFDGSKLLLDLLEKRGMSTQHLVRFAPPAILLLLFFEEWFGPALLSRAIFGIISLAQALAFSTFS